MKVNGHVSCTNDTCHHYTNFLFSSQAPNTGLEKISTTPMAHWFTFRCGNRQELLSELTSNCTAKYGKYSLLSHSKNTH